MPAAMKVDAVKQFVALRAALTSEKARLQVRLAEIERALGAAAPSVKSVPSSSRRARARNAMSLKEAVARVTRNKPMTRPEILEAIKKIGYKFTAQDPMNSLNVTLYTKGNFKNKNGKFSPLK
jgi:hypothetical protein